MTVRRAVDAAELVVDLPERVVVQRPPRHGRADYATGIALQLAGPAGRAPRDVAEILRRRLAREPGIAEVEIAGPGFLNITLSSRAYGDVVRRVRDQGAEYGRGEGLADERVTVAAEPGAVRGQLVADVVNLLLTHAGARPGETPERIVVAEPVLVDGADGSASSDGSGSAAAPAAPAAPGPRLGSAPSAGDPVPVPAPVPAPAPAYTHLALDALGRDASRWALLRPPAEDAPRLGGPEAAALLAQREANPLFRVRYAHARTRALLRNAHELGVDLSDTLDTRDVPDTPGSGTPTVRGSDTAVPDPDPATESDSATDPEPYAGPDPYPSPCPCHPAETELLGLIADFPRVIESAARRRGPDRVARHLERLADAFFRFHDECPPLPKGDEKPSAVHAARIRLTDAAGIVLAGGLRLLGISAPDRI